MFLSILSILGCFVFLRPLYYVLRCGNGYPLGAYCGLMTMVHRSFPGLKFLVIHNRSFRFLFRDSHTRLLRHRIYSHFHFSPLPSYWPSFR